MLFPIKSLEIKKPLKCKKCEKNKKTLKKTFYICTEKGERRNGRKSAECAVVPWRWHTFYWWGSYSDRDSNSHRLQTTHRAHATDHTHREQATDHTHREQATDHTHREQATDHIQSTQRPVNYDWETNDCMSITGRCSKEIAKKLFEHFFRITIILHLRPHHCVRRPHHCLANSRTKLIFQDFPGPGNFTNTWHDFPRGMGNGCVCVDRWNATTVTSYQYTCATSGQ